MTRKADLIALRDAVQADEYEPDMFCPMWHSSGLCIEAENAAFGDSVDAALAFLAAVLPGWSCEARRSGFGSAQAAVWNPMKQPGRANEYRVNNSDPARALLIATLNALIGGAE